MPLTQSKTNSGPTRTLRPARALVVEDELSTARLLEFVLTKQGYSAQTAADGPEALESVREFKPDVILLDLQLPGMSGLEVLRRMRIMPGAENTIVVILTAGAFQEASTEVLEASAQAFRSKPLAPSTLFQTLESLGVPPRLEILGSAIR